MLQIYFLVEEGANHSDIDDLLEQFGIPMGPFKVLDMEGNLCIVAFNYV